MAQRKGRWKLERCEWPSRSCALVIKLRVTRTSYLTRFRIWFQNMYSTVFLIEINEACRSLWTQTYLVNRLHIFSGMLCKVLNAYRTIWRPKTSEHITCDSLFQHKWTAVKFVDFRVDWKAEVSIFCLPSTAWQRCYQLNYQQLHFLNCFLKIFSTFVK